MKTFILLSVLALFLAGCHTTYQPNAPIPPQPPVPEPNMRQDTAGDGAVAPGRLPGEELGQLPSLPEPVQDEPAAHHRRRHARRERIEMNDAHPAPNGYDDAPHYPRAHGGYETVQRDYFIRPALPIPFAISGALIGGAFGHGHDRWENAGRGALTGAGIGLLLEMLDN